MDITDILMGGGGAPSAKFKTVGDIVRGTITDTRVSQARNFDDGKPATWDDGNPIMQVEVTLQTDLRDPEITDDDGKRRIFARQSSAMQRALAEAVTEAGAQTLEKGGVLGVQFTGEEPSKRGNPKKLFKAKYQPPAVSQTADLLGTSQPQQQAPTPQLSGADL